jgi:hypothetical protein
MCLHAAISDEFGVGAERARDGKGRRAANSVEAEFGIAKTSESFGHSHFRNVSAWEMEEVRWGGGVRVKYALLLCRNDARRRTPPGRLHRHRCS